jgi:DNA polymerase
MQNLRRNSIEDLAVARALVKGGDYEAVKLLYGNVPDTLSQLVRTAFIPRKGYRFIVADFSAIEARVLSWLAGETWRMEIFAENGDIYCASASQMFQVPVEKHGRNAHLRQKGKVSELALGFGGSVGALTAMGALDMGLKEDELRPLVDAWRQSNPNIVQFWWDVDKAALDAVREGITTEMHNLTFSYEGNGLFITLPSTRKLAYVRPKIETNDFGSDCVTYEGTGSTKKWERIATFGGKLAENIIQAISRDLLCHAMQHLESLGCRIVMHIHDEVVIEAPVGMDVQDVCRRMSCVPPWAEGLLLNADGYETDFYKKD